MAQVKYNLFLLIITLLVIFVYLFLLPNECKKCFSKGVKVIRIIFFILAICTVLLMVLSIDYTGKPTVSGKIIEVYQHSSRGGFYDRYVVRILTDDNKICEIDSVYSVNAKSLENIKNLRIGDRVVIYGSSITPIFFYKIEAY